MAMASQFVLDRGELHMTAYCGGAHTIQHLPGPNVVVLVEVGGGNCPHFRVNVSQSWLRIPIVLAAAQGHPVVGQPFLRRTQPPEPLPVYLHSPIAQRSGGTVEVGVQQLHGGLGPLVVVGPLVVGDDVVVGGNLQKVTVSPPQVPFGVGGGASQVHPPKIEQPYDSNRQTLGGSTPTSFHSQNPLHTGGGEVVFGGLVDGSQTHRPLTQSGSAGGAGGT